MPSFAQRARGEELMDDFSIVDERLLSALRQLRWINRLLGGYATSMRALAPLLRTEGLTILDLGTGIADYPEHFVRWADRQGTPVRVTGIDLNPVTVEVAAQTLDRRLPGRLRGAVTVAVGDALALPYEDDAFDVVTAAMFMHHLPDAEAVQLLREMDRVARRGILVNDLHRHPLAYYSFKTLMTLLPVSPMVRHDGPLSILRGFTRGELVAIAGAAGLHDADIRWQWAYRWILSTLHTD